MANTTKEKNESDLIEIDLLKIFQGLRKKIWIILLTGIIFGGLACACTLFMMTPVYTSSASILILTQDQNKETASDLERDTQLTKDYNVLITSRPVLEAVIKELDLDMRYEDLKGMITVNNPADTRILELSVLDTDPERAKIIVDKLTKVSSHFIGEKMEMVTPKIIDVGNGPTDKPGPNLLLNVLIGIFLGFVLSAGIIIIGIFRDDNIKTEEDVEEYLGLHVLTSIPYSKQLAEDNKTSKRKGKRKGSKE